MRSILSTLTVLFILFSSSMSWGSVDGKGLYCVLKWEMSPHKEKEDLLGFVFEDGKVRQIGIKFSNDKYFIGLTFIPQIFTTTERRIRWEFKMRYFLNRQTLELDLNGGNLLAQFNSAYDCEVYPNFQKLKERLSAEVKRLQQSYDKGRKDNKI